MCIKRRILSSNQRTHRRTNCNPMLHSSRMPYVICSVHKPLGQNPGKKPFRRSSWTEWPTYGGGSIRGRRHDFCYEARWFSGNTWRGTNLSESVWSVLKHQELQSLSDWMMGENCELPGCRLSPDHKDSRYHIQQHDRPSNARRLGADDTQSHGKS